MKNRIGVTRWRFLTSRKFRSARIVDKLLVYLSKGVLYLSKGVSVILKTISILHSRSFTLIYIFKHFCDTRENSCMIVVMVTCARDTACFVVCVHLEFPTPRLSNDTFGYIKNVYLEISLRGFGCCSQPISHFAVSCTILVCCSHQLAICLGRLTFLRW